MTTRIIFLLCLLLAPVAALAQTQGVTPGINGAASGGGGGAGVSSFGSSATDIAASASTGPVTIHHTGQTCTAPSCTVTAGTVRADASGGALIVNLPATSGTNNPVSICKIDTTTNSVDVSPNGTDNISGLPTNQDYFLTSANQCVQLVDTSSGLWSISNERWPTGAMPASQVSGTAFTVNNNLNEGNPQKMRAALGVDNGAAIQAMPAVGVPGNWAPVVATQPHTLPAASTTLTCYGTSGTIPYEDRWTGTLASNTSLALPSPGSCAPGSTETLLAIQGASAFTFAVTGTIATTPRWTIGPLAGNEYLVQYIDMGTTWVGIEAGTVPAQFIPNSTNALFQENNAVASLSMSSTSTAYDLLNPTGPGFSVPANTLTGKHSLDLDIDGAYNNSSSTDTNISIIVNYGGGIIPGGTGANLSTAIASSTSPHHFHLYCSLQGNAAGSAEVGWCHFMLWPAAVNSNWNTGAPIINAAVSSPSMAVDATVAETLRVTIQDADTGNAVVKTFRTTIKAQ